ncbi:MAG TPA: DUF302 domain-containing protein [Acidimicrobiales bacterium]
MRAIEKVVGMPLADAEAAVREALSAQGFGVLTEIDVAATLKEKIGVDRPALKILGACNPSLAHQALEIDPSVSLALPCNVVVESTDAGTRVAAVDPHEIMDDPRFGELADDAAARLRAAVEAVGT